MRSKDTAEANFAASSADEDSLTGALGQALAMPTPWRFLGPEGDYEVQVMYTKLRGRGHNAPEKLYGSDGIFQIEIASADGTVLRRKGLPFQSKTNWRGRNRSVASQAEKMQATKQPAAIGMLCQPNTTAQHEQARKTRKRVFLYCNPHDRVISIDTVKGMGWLGLDDKDVQETRAEGLLLARVAFSLSTWTRNGRSRHGVPLLQRAADVCGLATERLSGQEAGISILRGQRLCPICSD